MTYRDFLWRNRRFLAFGFLTAFFSSFGQTYFIAVFGPAIRAEFGLSHGEFGGLYAIGTMASAVVLIWAGRLIDRLPLRQFAPGLAVALAGACALLALAPGALFLALALFALRLTGQGLMSHTAMTSMARYFEAERGRAVAIAMLGFPTAVAVFPLMAVALNEAFGWRQAWALMALAVGVGLAPLMLWLLRGHGMRHRRFLVRTTRRAAAANDGGQTPARRQWTRAEVLRDPRFYLLGLAVMAPSFIVTGFFFHQAQLAADKGWTAAFMASAFIGYTVGSITGSLIVGHAVDRFGAIRIAPFYQLPLALACLLIAVVEAPPVALAFTMLIGLTSGGGQTLIGTIWPELYGVLHLGAIRAMVMSMSVVASALSPVGMGWLIDQQVAMQTIAIWCLGYALVACGLIVLALRPRAGG